MSLLQEKTIELLPKNNYNVNKSMLEAGYKPSTANSGQQYGRIRSRLAKKGYFTEESVRKNIVLAQKLALKKEDLTNFLRANELQSKILGMQIDKSEVKNLNPEKIVIAYGTAPSKSE